MTEQKFSVDEGVVVKQLSPSRSEVKRLEKFRRLVRHANENSPYYARIIRESGINPENCVPADFPVLTKSLLMANFDDIITDRRITRQGVADFLTKSTDPKDRLINKYTVMHTSGTSGEVGYFLTSFADLRRSFSGVYRMRSERRKRRKFPLRSLRRLRMAFYGATGGHYAGVTMVTRMQQGIARLFLKAEAFEVNSPLHSVIEGLNAFQPDFIFGYTMALRILGEQQRSGVLHIKPVAIAATGEMVTSADIQFLSESFGGADVTSMYGCTEHGMMGYSNVDDDSMTLVEDNLFFEFHDDHSIVTNLGNYTMPLIRYRMSDILLPISEPGAHPTIIKNLVGRCEQMPAFTNSLGETDFISPHTINEVFVKGVRRFQMQLVSDTSFRFPICIEEGLSTAQQAEVVHGVEARLQEILQQKGLGNVSAEVAVVEEIPVNPRTRKFQLIVDTRKQ